ncbi:hypothetical protein NQ317_018952 [Molorchus minor]|uniref:Myrosinase 1-like n=1 Tax=Molorchus minor TaxID=1323400 RepID=A0ABQ9J569_9CUCU|nr:hypothetical protein NQ317_018952 [Molorchus minor]
MILCVIIVIFLSFVIVKTEENRTFPDGFLFGVATSAFQIEGAWHDDGKGENIWDRWIHEDPTRIENNDSADIACNSYHNFKADVAAAAYLKAKHYKFSISWSRVLPTGQNTSINLKGLMYYQDLVDEIKSHNITPVATIYHHDLPQPLQELGGWINPEIEQFFVEYARVVFQALPGIEYWITFDDPRAVCRLGYGVGTQAPGISMDGVGEYLCAYTVIKSHASVYRMYKEEFSKLNAKISIAVDFDWSEPASDSQEDKDAAERRTSFEFGLFAHPIYKGNWPQVVIDRVGRRSQHENLTASRLPELTPEEVDRLNGTADFMAINSYYTIIVTNILEPPYGDPGYMKDMKANKSLNPDWDVASNGNPIVPWGLRKVLNWLKYNYGDPSIFITGNGVSDERNSLEDTDRITYFTEYLGAVLDAIYLDGVKVFGYTAWSLLDNFEWTNGYSQRFGLYHVNFTDPNKSRKAKSSAGFFRAIAETNNVPEGATTATPTTSLPGTTEGSAHKVVMHPLKVSMTCLVLFYIRLSQLNISI